MPLPEPRFTAVSAEGSKWAVWDSKFGRWADKRWWFQPAIARSEADRLNRMIVPEAGAMSTTDGLGG